MSDDRYVVEIKSSARRANGAVGRTINRRGVRHRFESRAQAETWAAGLSSRGERTVWIRRANPNDPAPVDAYLMSRRPPAEGGPVRPVDGGPDDAARWDARENGTGADRTSGDSTAAESGSETGDGEGGEGNDPDPPGDQAAIAEYGGRERDPDGEDP